VIVRDLVFMAIVKAIADFSGTVEEAILNPFRLFAD